MDNGHKKSPIHPCKRIFISRPKKEIEISLAKSITSDNLQSLVVEGAEIGLKLIFETGVAEQIPIFSILYKSGKTVYGIKEYFFAKKVYKFLVEIKDISTADRQAFIKEFDKHENYEQKTGETLLFLLERLDHVQKPSILGKLLKARIKGDISFESFLRLSFVVERIFIRDLFYLKLYEQERYDTSISESLASLGLVYQFLTAGSNFYVEPDQFKYKITKLGEELVKFGVYIKYT